MFIDWNRDGKTDCVDVGIGIASQLQPDEAGINIGGFFFSFVQELEPERTITGKIRLFDPKTEYAKRDKKPLNKYGKGPFCRFAITSGYSHRKGVYALFDDEHLLYIGQTVNLEQRYNRGYGNIQPINCYVGGQSTNCKINAMVLKKYQEGNHVFLYFCETEDYDAVEHELINLLNPEYNSQYASDYEHKSRGVTDSFVKGDIRMKKDFDVIWRRIVSLQGETFYTMRGKPFTYKVVGNNLIPLHIAYGNPTKSGFEKAYNLERIVSPSQLNSEGIMGPSYVYAILTDERVKTVINE